MKSRTFILSIIVLAQFFCTSIWFASNAVITDIINQFQLSESALGHLTSSVQFGFISGTLVFALLMIPDRFSPSKVFFISAIFASIFNAALILGGNTYTSLFILRFLAGFTLAGIYPVGIKIAADYFPKSLGLALSYLVGALVLGTGLPHLIKGASIGFSWEETILATSILCCLGGCLMLMVKDGPFRSTGQSIKLKSIFKIFKNKKFTASAFGYFGHMWELYAFLAFVPIILTYGLDELDFLYYNISLVSFFIIAIGSIACVIGGYISEQKGIAKTAFLSLFISGVCCLICPIILIYFPFSIRIVFMLLWGSFVITDSPLFSSLVANNAPQEIKGTAITIVTCLGFAITILSIELLTTLSESNPSPYVYMLLALGPIIGMWRTFVLTR